jgi:hypothetical protein
MAHATRTSASEAAPRRGGLWLAAGAAGLLVAAGLLMWSRHGAAVFGEYALAALAWCF